ncbi:MAG TPA: hypothetical protein VF202_14305 [Trueperaceae bacterium]
MKEQTVIIQKGGSLSRIVGLLSALVKEMPLKVTIAEYRRTRSLEQNAYLWGCVYPTILQHLPGWDAEDLHEYFLGEWSGWEVLEGFGRKRMRPIRRSSKLKTTEFMDFVAFIQRRMAEHGVYIPDPNEDMRNVA